jgi:hypothetical protein
MTLPTLPGMINQILQHRHTHEHTHGTYAMSISHGQPLGARNECLAALAQDLIIGVFRLLITFPQCVVYLVVACSPARHLWMSNEAVPDVQEAGTWL